MFKYLLSVIAFFCLPFFLHAQNPSFRISHLDFGSSNPVANALSLQFGPDGRLYVAEMSGTIRIFKIEKKAPGRFVAAAAEILETIRNHPNRNDVGKIDAQLNYRLATALAVGGTPAAPVVYVSSSDPRAGGPNGDKDLDTNSGVISRLNWNGKIWETVDLVRGLPRSEEYHGSNGLELTEINGKPWLLLCQGGNTNAGAPSQNFANLTEYALAAAILAIDLEALNKMPVKTDAETGRRYVYDLPTLDDPTRSNTNGIDDPKTPGYTGIDAGDPWGGNDGLNQAMMVPGGPVQIFAPGFRNSFDLLVTKSGAVYATDNGGNPGWGGYPDGEGLTGKTTNRYLEGEPGSSNPFGDEKALNNKDELTLITPELARYKFGSFYGGHPNPLRANPAGAGLYARDELGAYPKNKGLNERFFRDSILSPGDPRFKTRSLPVNWPPVPLDRANPVEGDYRLPGLPNPDGPADALVTVLPTNSNAIDEYTTDHFKASMKGDLIIGKNGGELLRVQLNPDGSLKKLHQKWVSGLNGNPLGIHCSSETDPFPGTIWVALFNNKIAVLEPSPPIRCVLPGEISYNPLGDNDFDGYSNLDEAGNGTDLCAANSMPTDCDGDLVSDLLDLDDDNDGILDEKDPFQLGKAFDLPVYNELFSDQADLGGFLGLGFTGLMNAGKPGPNYLQALDRPNESQTDVDDIYGGAIGGITVYMTPGDAAADKQEKAFQFGVQVDEQTDTFIVKSRMLPPFHAFEAGQSQGIFIGTGFQDNYVKLVLGKNGLSVGGENAGEVLTKMPAQTLSPVSTALDLYWIVSPKTGMIQAAYATETDAQYRFVGKPFAASGALLDAIRMPGTPLAVGIIGTCGGGTEFPASWDFINVYQKNLPPPKGIVFRVNAGGPTVQAIDGGPDWKSDQEATLARDRFEVNTGGIYKAAAISWAAGVSAEIRARTPFQIFDTERYDGETSPDMRYTFKVDKPGKYTVRYFVREAYGNHMQGSRVFTVLINGKISPLFSMVDLTAQFGMKAATVLETEVETTEPIITLDFMRNVENPFVCGIEIIDRNGGNRDFKKESTTPLQPAPAPQTPPSAPPTIKGFNHIAMAVRNLEESARFYRDVIGLTQIEVPENLRNRYVWFRLGTGQELHLLVGRANNVSNQDVNGSHLALTVDDADAVQKYFQEKKITFRRHVRFDGASQIYINDPDGYMIEFNEPKR